MSEVDFYLIAKPRFRDDPRLLLCELAKKAYEAGLSTVVLVRTAADAEALDDLLWSFEEDAFVPHQIAGGEDDEEAAVLIVPPGFEAPGRALAINLRDECAPPEFERVKEVIPADEAERQGSRRRWAEYKQRGYTLRKFDL